MEQPPPIDRLYLLLDEDPLAVDPSHSYDA